MREVLEASLQFPTIIFTGLLVIMAILWVVSLVGIGDLDGFEDSADGMFDDALQRFGLAEVPITVLLSIVALVGWLVSVLAQINLLDSFGGTALALASIVVGVVAAGVALIVASMASPWLAGIFETHTTHEARDLVGATAEVRSQDVTTDHGYGDARTPDGTSSRVDLRARADVAATPIMVGAVVVLVDYDANANTYIVEPLPAELGG